MVTGATTYNDLYLDIRRTLLKADSGAASLEARELVMAASGKTKDEFYRDSRLYVPEAVRRSVSELLERRLGGEPIAYIAGSWEFYGITLHITPDVLIPRIDTEMLARTAIEELETRSGHTRVLDLCCGSGCVGIAVARNVRDCNVVLGDSSGDALRVAMRNVRSNGLSSRMLCVEMDALRMPDPSLGEFDVIVCNPPYIKTGDIETLDQSVSRFEPRAALDGGADGLDFYRAVSRSWKDSIKDGGAVFFECGIGMALDVADILEDAGFTEIGIVKDIENIDRVVCASVKREV